MKRDEKIKASEKRRQAKVQALIRKGDIEVCPVCEGLSAYSHLDVDEEHGINHIGATSCFEWECGHCHRSFADADSPIMAECYTHIPR
jgi:hypothetical protein